MVRGYTPRPLPKALLAKPRWYRGWRRDGCQAEAGSGDVGAQCGLFGGFVGVAGGHLEEGGEDDEGAGWVRHAAFGGVEELDCFGWESDRGDRPGGVHGGQDMRKRIRIQWYCAIGLEGILYSAMPRASQDPSGAKRPIMIRLSPRHLEILDSLARAKGWSRNALIERLLERAAPK